MIQANELRVDNYIKLYRKPSDKEMSYHKIKGVFFNDRLKEYLVELEDGFCVKISKGIEPIPLTEDILLKCGFKDIGEKLYCKRYRLNRVDIYKMISGKYPFYFRYNQQDLEVKYLHRLQNLFFEVKNKELEVNL